jgi:PAS domain S-box-containing protein
MTMPEPSAQEASRQTVLDEYPFERAGLGEQLDRLARLAAQICDVPVALVSIVEETRQVFIGRHGTALTETPREWSFCAWAMLEPHVMVVGDATADSRFVNNPLVTADPEIRYYAGQPLRSSEGTPLGSLCVIDTVAREGLSELQREGLETLALAAMALLERARVEGRSERAAVHSRATIADLEQRFQLLADAMPQLVWATPPDGLPDYFNGVWCDFTGLPPEASHGNGWLNLLHPEDLNATTDSWANAVATGGTFEVEYRLRRHDGEHRWMLTRGLPMRGADGAITRWIGTCTDVHAQREAADQRDLLTRELSHRIKNIFAVIGGLIAMTTRRQPEFKEAGRELQQRVLSLGRAHDVVRPQSESFGGAQSHGSLKGMLAALLAPYGHGSESPIAIDGDDVAIDDRSATALALFFHELATNAAKYGGLSAADGRVAILIAAGDPVRIDWHETGGPAPMPSPDRGFGASLIEMSIGRQLSGRLEHAWHPEGLRLRAEVPAAMMRR